jgi:hypothetical protein
MDYLLRPQDETLIRAALALGDWILAQPKVTRQNRRAVAALQDALRALPAAPPPMIAEYGFHARWDPPDGKGGLYRAWRVSLSPAGLEIFSVYSPDEKIEYEDKLSHELNFWLRPAQLSRHDGYYVAEWMEEASNPERFRADGALFGYMAELEAVGD